MSCLVRKYLSRNLFLLNYFIRTLTNVLVIVIEVTITVRDEQFCLLDSIFLYRFKYIS